MEVTKALIPCKVSKGMFENEVAIEIEAPDGRTLSFFADKSLVRTIESKTFLEVSLAKSTPKAPERTVLLPSESFEAGSRWVSVPSDSLHPA